MALAKTTRPRLAGVFPRKRLFRALDRNMKRPVIWVQGPPGAGKTTLVASYIQSRKLSCLWYQVDEGDGDIASFFYHLRQAAPRRRRALPLLTLEYLPGLTVFTQRFFRELYGRLKTPFVLVLDNYQDVSENSNFHEVVGIALAEFPEKGHAIVISRNAPPPSMARLRASRTFSFVGGSELRLTFDEAKGLVRSITDERIARATLKPIYETVDGWTAGLVLVLERMKLERHAITQRRGRTPQDVFDYFASEIFRKIDRDTQEVLLQSAFLPRVTTSMAEELTQIPSAGQIIERLSQDNYFTNKHDAPEPTYQYHPLFREFLLSQAGKTFALKRRVQIQQAAAALLEKAGQIEDAVALLRDAEDWKTLARLIQEHAQNLLGQGRGQTAEQWLASLPEWIFQEQPWLLYWRGVCREPFNPAEGRQYMEKAFDLFRARRDSTGAFSAWSAIMVNFIHEVNAFQPVDKWIQLFPQLRDEFPTFPSAEIEARVAAAMMLAMTARQPHREELPIWAGRGLELSQTIGDPGLRAQIIFCLACYHYWTGDFTKGLVVVEPLRGVTRSSQIPIVDRLIAIFMTARYEWLTVSPDVGIRTLVEALELAEAAGVHVLDSQIFLECAVAALSVADHATAERYLQKVSPILGKLTRTDLASYHYVCAWIAFLKGNFSLASSHQETGLKLVIDVGMPLFEAICRLFSAQVLHERGNNDAAEEFVSLSLELARQGRAEFVEYMARLTEAQLALDLGKERKGLSALAKAMMLGRQHGYINTFTWRAEVMARLCAKALEAGIEVEYVKQLISKRGLILEKPPMEIEQWPWAVKIYSLGHFSLLKNDEPVQFSRKSQRKPLDLLKALIALGGRHVSESQLSEILWPDSEGDLAHRSLSTTLHRLRRLLGREETIQRQEGKLTLDPSLCWVDVWAVERLLARAESHASRAEPGDELWTDIEDSVKKAAALYHGPFLGDEESGWGSGMTKRLQRRLLRALGQVGRHHERNSAWDKAIDCYERAVEIVPCSEDFYRRLITTYQRLGRRIDALSAYERCRKTLSAIMGLAPAAETQALYRFMTGESSTVSNPLRSS